MIDSKGNCIVVASPDPGFAHLVLASPPYRVSLLAQPPKVAATSPDFCLSQTLHILPSFAETAVPTCSTWTTSV